MQDTGQNMQDTSQNPQDTNKTNQNSLEKQGVTQQKIQIRMAKMRAKRGKGNGQNGKGNGRTGFCGCCKHKDKGEIDSHIASGRLTLRAIAKRYGIGLSAVCNHKKMHIIEPLPASVVPAVVLYSAPAIGGSPIVDALQDVFDGLTRKIKEFGGRDIDKHLKVVASLVSLAGSIFKGLETTISLSSRRLAIVQGLANPMSDLQVEELRAALVHHSLPSSVGEILAGSLKAIKPDGSIDNDARLRAIAALGDIVRPKY